MNISDIEAEIAELMKLKEEAEKAELEAKRSKKSITVISFISGWINLQIDDNNPEVSKVFLGIPGIIRSTFDYDKYMVQVIHWDTVRADLEGASIEINYRLPSIPDSIEAYINAPEYKIEVTDNSFSTFIHEKVKNNNLQYYINSANHKGVSKFYAGYTKYEVPFFDVRKLYSFIQNEEAKYNRLSDWHPAALKRAIDAVESENKLTSILTSNDDSSIQVDFHSPFIKMRPFQKAGISMMNLTDGKCLNADAVGLGKTLQAIGYTILKRKANPKFKTLLITTGALTANLRKEITKLTGCTPLVLSGIAPKESDMYNIFKGNIPEYTIINYTILGREVPNPEYNPHVHNEDDRTSQLWVKLLELTNKFDAIIVDEAHHIRNIDSSRSKAVRKLSKLGKHRIALTATPVVNGVGDYWPMLYFIRPDLVPSYAQFVNNFTTDGRRPRNLDDLKDLLKPIMLKRSKDQVLKDFPMEPNRIPQYRELSDPARKNYDLLLNGIYETLKTYDPDNPGSASMLTHHLAALMRMKQAAAADNIEFTGDLAQSIIDSRTENDKHPKVIIYTQFNPVVSQLSKYLRELNPLTITGEDNKTSESKLAVVDEFTSNPDKHILICNIHAASEGLNITIAGSVIFNDLPWTPAAIEQAEGRAFGRLVDPHPIDSYFILASETIMEGTWNLLDTKWATIAQAVDEVEKARLAGASVVMELLKDMRRRIK